MRLADGVFVNDVGVISIDDVFEEVETGYRDMGDVSKLRPYMVGFIGNDPVVKADLSAADFEYPEKLKYQCGMLLDLVALARPDIIGIAGSIDLKNNKTWNDVWVKYGQDVRVFFISMSGGGVKKVKIWVTFNKLIYVYDSRNNDPIIPALEALFPLG